MESQVERLMSLKGRFHFSKKFPTEKTAKTINDFLDKNPYIGKSPLPEDLVIMSKETKEGERIYNQLIKYYGPKDFHFLRNNINFIYNLPRILYPFT